ncbi:MAG: diadenylate cyclase [Candidatus Aenigmatarchaeota archaeon]
MKNQLFTGKEFQIYKSIRDYRSSMKENRGLFITSGPTEILFRISSPIVKNHSKYGKELNDFLYKNRERQLIFEEGYDPVLKELYEMLSQTDGTSHFEDGYLKAVKRYIEGVNIRGIEGGARHKAAAYASLYGLKSYVLSEETGKITIFENGKRLLEDPLENLCEHANYEFLDSYH